MKYFTIGLLLTVLPLLITNCSSYQPTQVYAPSVGGWASNELNGIVNQTVSHWEYRQQHARYNHQNFNRSLADVQDAIAALKSKNAERAQVMQTRLQGFLTKVNVEHVDWGNNYVTQDLVTQLSQIRSSVVTELTAQSSQGR